MCTRLLLTVIVGLVGKGKPADMTERSGPIAEKQAIVASGHARFTVLTSGLIRMEWSAGGEFEDRPSFVFINRRLPVPPFETKRADGWLIVKTDELTLRYREGSGRFCADNLSVQLTLGGRLVIWQPGTPETGNLRGTARTLDGVSGSCPLEKGLLSRDGWSVVDDSRTLLLDGDPPWATPRKDPEAIDWYFFGYGHDYERALKDYTRVAGRIPLPPRFVFGAWWSRYWAYSDEELRALVRQFDEHDVPLDVLVVDIDWHLDGWTGYTWNPKYFPDPEGFIKWVHAQGLRTTLNLHPHHGVGKHEAAFTDVARAMGLDPETTDRVPFDCGDPKYMDAYFKYLHHPKERQGVDFWWIDWQQGEQTKIPGLDPLWWLNHLHWQDMERNPERRGRRPVIFSRWGGLGNHRYQIGFSGDTFCNWASLAFQPCFTATAGNVGFAYWSHDIGGHQPGPVDPELYTRWIQYGVFSPVLRTHTTKNPAAERRIWEFPDEYFQAMRKAFHLRYELLPYIYTAARQCYDTALPMCRPLYYAWPELDEAYEHPGEYMFGDDLLVAPVTKPASALSGWAQISVWLPPGRWTHFFTGRTYEGAGQVAFLVPLDEIPLFVREGGIIPTMPEMKRTDERPLDPLVLHIFPGEPGHTRIYEDDGASPGYLGNKCAWTPVLHETAAGERRIVIGPVEGNYSGMLTQRRYELHLRDVWPAESVTVNGRHLPKVADSSVPGWSYDAASFCVVIRLAPTDVREKTVIAVKPFEDRLDEAELRGGLRGKLARIADAAAQLDHEQWWLEADVVQQLADGNRDAPGLVVDAARAKWRELIRASADSSIVQPAVARLLNMVCTTQVSGRGEGKAGLSVRITFNVAAPFDDFDDLGGKIELDLLPNWVLQGRRQWRFPLAPAGKPLSFDTVILPEDSSQTTVLSGQVRLEKITRLRQPAPLPRSDRLPERKVDPDPILSESDRWITLPIRQVILPSINRWWIVGPFDAPKSDRLQTEFPPEEQLDLKATYDGKDGQRIGWRQVERSITADSDLTDEFFVEFHKLFGGYQANAVAYALTYLHAPRAMDAVLALGSDDGVVVWLNGSEVYRHDIGRPYSSKEDSVPVRLKRGSNELLLKISQGNGMWGFGVHVETAGGDPVPEVLIKPTP